MPELPEIETIRQGMQVNIGSKIINLTVNRAEVIRLKDYEPAKLYNKTIAQVSRRGKFFVFELEENYNMVFHLGMSGRFFMVKPDYIINEPHVHVIVELDNENRLVYQDARRFGGVWLVKDINSFFAKMGVEPLSEEFNAKYLYEITRKRKIAIKTLLLNQHLIAGIGNIYADESLFTAGIRPDRSAGTLTMEEADKLCRAVKEVLATSIKERGTTFRDFRDSYNMTGNFQNFLKVYGKTNEKCPNCGQILTREKIGGRSSHYCTSCQQ